MALEGIRVVERVGRLAGSVCAGRLADLGAELVRVAVDGDPLPNEPAAWREHPFANPPAEMIRLDRGDPGFGARWEGIADKADIVIVTPEIRENGKAVADFAGLNAERQVICAVSAFGIAAQDPPLADPGEIEMQAIGGSLATTGGTDGAPCTVDLPILELFTGLNAATAALAALRVKEVGPHAGLSQWLPPPAGGSLERLSHIEWLGHPVHHKQSELAGPDAGDQSARAGRRPRIRYCGRAHICRGKGGSGDFGMVAHRDDRTGAGGPSGLRHSIGHGGHDSESGTCGHTGSLSPHGGASQVCTAQYRFRRPAGAPSRRYSRSGGRALYCRAAGGAVSGQSRG
jgi:hypothetical protein